MKTTEFSISIQRKFFFQHVFSALIPIPIITFGQSQLLKIWDDLAIYFIFIILDLTITYFITSSRGNFNSARIVTSQDCFERLWTSIWKSLDWHQTGRAQFQLDILPSFFCRHLPFMLRLCARSLLVIKQCTDRKFNSWTCDCDISAQRQQHLKKGRMQFLLEQTVWKIFGFNALLTRTRERDN